MLDIDALVSASDKQAARDQHGAHRSRRCWASATAPYAGRISLETEFAGFSMGSRGQRLEFEHPGRAHISDRMAAQGGYRSVKLKGEDGPRPERLHQRMAIRAGAEPLARARERAAACPRRSRSAASPAGIVRDYLDHLRVERGLWPRTRSWPTASDLARLERLRRRPPARRAGAGQRISATSSAACTGPGPVHASVARAVHAVRGPLPLRRARGAARRRPHGEPARPRAPSRRCRASSRWRRSRRCWTRPTSPPRSGLRDRAILEVLYATGLRVSELIGLRPRTSTWTWACSPASARAGKERLVPLGQQARQWMRRYCVRGRGRGCGSARRARLFLNHRGGRLSRMGLWGIVRRHAVSAGRRNGC